MIGGEGVRSDNTSPSIMAVHIYLLIINITDFD